MNKLLIVLLVFFATTAWCQQDPLYNQYQFNQLMINPAYAGIYDEVAAGVISRFQWTGIEGAPRTNTLFLRSGLKDGKVGLAGLILNDRFGVSNNLELQLSASYNIVFENGRLGMGLQSGLVQYGYDFTDVNFDFLDDPEIINGHENVFRPNFGVGFMYLNEHFFAGLSVPRMLNVDISDGVTVSKRYKRHYYLTTGAIKEINRIPYKLVLLIQSMDFDKITADVSFSTLIDDVVWVGFTTRNLNTYGFFTNFNAWDHFMIGYSFEMPSNSLVYGNYGTHEVSLTFSLANTRIPQFRKKFF